ALGEADLEDLPRVVPVVHRRRDVEALVALKTDQLSAERGRERFRDLGLPDTCLTFDKERLPQTEREEERDGERAVRDVALAVERGRDSLDRRHHGALTIRDATSGQETLRRRPCGAGAA